MKLINPSKIATKLMIVLCALSILSCSISVGGNRTKPEDEKKEAAKK